MWNLPAPPGFCGFDEHKPVRIYHRHLPHWRQEGVTYFVTFRLADSIPEAKLRELAELHELWKKNADRLSGLAAKVRDERYLRAVMARVENWLDAGFGDCVLKKPWAASELIQSLEHHDRKKYDLLAYVVMPNHVHLLACPYSDEQFPLEKLASGWKSFSALAINRRLGQEGAFWQQEAFDRIVRDEEHLYRCLQYIGSNPKRAGLRLADCTRYVRPEWIAAGWDFAP